MMYSLKQITKSRMPHLVFWRSLNVKLQITEPKYFFDFYLWEKYPLGY